MNVITYITEIIINKYTHRFKVYKSNYTEHSNVQNLGKTLSDLWFPLFRPFFIFSFFHFIFSFHFFISFFHFVFSFHFFHFLHF